MNILIKPIVTEKANLQTEKSNCYAFVVDKNANKIQIKEAVEATYGVEVAKVRTMIYPAVRKMRYNKKRGVDSKKSSYKKAIIQVAGDGIIDFYNN